MPGPAPELSSRLVRAGAGAGKTTGLVNQVSEVFREYRAAGLHPRVVVTTFTRKATQELKERLIKKACVDNDSEFLQFVSDPSKLHISTIHGLLNIFLKQVGHLAGLDAGFNLLSETEARHLARRALREAMVLHPGGLKWFELYDFNRVLAMCREYDRKAREGALQPATMEDIEAAAGPLIQSARESLKNLALTVLEENDNEEWVSFAHALKQFTSVWPDADPETLPKKPDKRSKVQKALSAWHDQAEEVLEKFKKQFSKPAWNRTLWPKMAALWGEFDSFAAEFSKQFNKLKEGQGKFEMNDLELLSAGLLRDTPVLGEVFAANWDYWMVDEYQDTSPIQAFCLENLINGRPKYVVGDPQQSIYLFRGADVGVFAEAEKEMGRAGADIRELRRNYRSEPALLQFINGFMNTVDGAFLPMETGAVENREPVCQILRAVDEATELEALVARVGELVAQGVSLQDICILGRAHNHLRDAATALKKHGFPTHLHASSGFYERREVLDAQALWMFLLNPHDNHNLITLLRSPWFFVEDAQLEKWMAHKPRSLWRYLQNQDTHAEAIARLEEARERMKAKGVVKTFESLLAENGQLDLCLQNDPAGRNESNLWKVIDKARGLEGEGTRSLLDLAGGDVVLDPLEASEGDATSAQEPNCINLMTVHAAKGLEFEHVIIPRMGKSLPPTRCADFSARDGKYFFPLRDDEDNSPSVLDLACADDQRRKEDAEFNRSLYVAVTRAKRSLTFLCSKVENGSWAARSPWFSLAPGRHDFDDYAFEVRTEHAAPIPYNANRADAAVVREPWLKAPAQPVSEKQTVTGMIAHKAPAKRGGALVRFEARNKGQRIHRILEGLKYGGVPEASGDPAVDFVVNLDDPPMAELIRNGFAEWGFQVKTPDGVVEGQIDLWGIHDGEIYIVDYKSGSPSHAEDAFSQLSLYGWALRRFGHTQKIWLVVIYPLQSVVERREFPESFEFTAATSVRGMQPNM